MSHRGSRSVLLTTAALVTLGLVLVGGAVALLATGSHNRAGAAPPATTAAPAATAPVPASVPTTATATTVTTTAAPAPPTSLAIARKIAARYRLEITSGYRTPAHNAAVGGVEGSYHTRGTPKNPGAVDLVGSLPDMRAALNWARLHVPNLAEGLIHSVCMADPARPWLVSDGGLHLHLAFAPTEDDPAAVNPDLLIDLASGCRNASTRFAFALASIERLHGANALSDDDVPKAQLRAAQRALDGGYGPLDPATRASAQAWKRQLEAPSSP